MLVEFVFLNFFHVSSLSKTTQYDTQYDADNSCMKTSYSFTCFTSDLSYESNWPMLPTSKLTLKIRPKSFWKLRSWFHFTHMKASLSTTRSDLRSRQISLNYLHLMSVKFTAVRPFVYLTFKCDLSGIVSKLPKTTLTLQLHFNVFIYMLTLEFNESKANSEEIEFHSVAGN